MVKRQTTISNFPAENCKISAARFFALQENKNALLVSTSNALSI